MDNRNNLPPALQNLLRNPAVRGENGRFQARSAQAAQERREERRHRTLLETIKDGATVAVESAKQTGQSLPGGATATAVGGVYGAAANELMQAVSWVKLDRFKRDKPPETTTINNDNSNTNSSNSSNSTRITRNERPQGVNPPRTSNSESDSEERRPRGRPRNSSNPLAGLQGRARAIRRREIQADNASIRATRELQNLNESTDEATQADRTQHREIIDRLKGIIKAIRSLKPFGGMPRLGGLGGGRGRGRNGRNGRNTRRGANGGYDGDNDRDRTMRNRGNRNNRNDEDEDEQRRRDDTQRRWDERRARRNGGNPPLPPVPPPVPPLPPGGGGRRGGMFRGMRGAGALAAVAGLFGLASIETDETLTREEKNRAHGENAGVVANGAAGAAAGAAIGTMIFPGVGTVVGGLIGGFAADYFAGDAASELGSKIADWIDDAPLSELPGRMLGKVGEWTDELKASAVGQAVIAKMGEWTQTLKDTKVGEYITGAWDTLTKDISSKWDTFSKTLTDTWENLKKGTEKTLEGVNGWIKDKTGIDVGAGITAAGAAISNGAAVVGDAASSAWEGAKDTASEVVTGRKSSVNERWQKAKGDIVGAAKTADVDAGILASIAHFESRGFDSNARPIAKNAAKNKVRQFDGTMAISSAHGYGQFTDATWTDSINKHGAKYGIAGAGSLTKDQAAKYRQDTKIQAAMLAEFTKENVATGKKLGGADDLANVYALHNLGSGEGGGGGKFLKALKSNQNAKVSSVLSSEVISGNGSLYGDGNITLAEAYKNMGNKMREGESYAKEASNLQNGVTAPTAGGLIASAANMAAGASSLYDKGKAWADGAIPNAVKGLRVKASDGSTKTLDEMGISSHADLQSKGGQAFQGGYNDPATLFATSLIQNGMGENFDRVTAQNDAYHSAKSPGSDHTKGTKTDFTVKGMSGKDADLKTAEIMAKWGLQKGVDFETINEYDKPSAKATGGHIDFKLREEGQAKIAKIMAMEKVATAHKAKPDTATGQAKPSEPHLKGSADPKNLPPKAGYEVKNTGSYYDYYEYVPTTTASTTAVARQESAIPAIAPVKTPDPLPQTAMQPPTKTTPTHPLEQFKQGGQQSPVIDTASITKAITAGFAGIKPQQSGLEQSKVGFASHIPVDIDDAYWLRATNGSFT